MPIPKPIIPKPVIPEVPGNVPGRIPPIKPEPKPPGGKPGQKPCKRTDGSDCYFSSDGEDWEEQLGVARPSGLDLNQEMVIEGGDKLTLHGSTAWKPDAKTVAAYSADFENNLKVFTKDLYWTIPNKSPEAASRGPNLVAAIYVPGKGVWFSTVPRGDAAKVILGDLDSAPALKSRVGATGRTTEEDLHAEDGAIYWFEKSQNHHMSAEEAKNWKFPEGTRLAVYGQVKKGEDQREVGPCTTTVKNQGTRYEFIRDPSCETVVTGFGITPITHW